NLYRSKSAEINHNNHESATLSYRNLPIFRSAELQPFSGNRVMNGSAILEDPQ
ncbi:hypothetical protein L9F63_017106, partial [Diploptera punctata]